MKKQSPQFVQIPDEIPYRKITAFNVKQVKYVNGAFDIKLDRKCENLPEEKQYKITRKTVDFKWLLEQLAKESPWVIVLPSIAEPSWSLMQAISTDQFKTKLKKWSNQVLQCRTVQRFFKIMSQITLKSIFKQHGFTHSSLYTFLDKSYELYKSEKYQQTGTKQAVVSSSSALTTLAHSIGKGSMKILGMLNVLKQQQASRYLQTHLSQCQILKSQLQEFNNEVVNLQSSLEVLEINFLNQQKSLKSKEQKLYQIYIKSSEILRLLTQIVGEIGQVSKRCELLEGKSEDKVSTKQQMDAYEKFTANEIAELQLQFTNIMEEFYEKCFEEHIDIKIVNLYPTKL